MGSSDGVFPFAQGSPGADGPPGRDGAAGVKVGIGVSLKVSTVGRGGHSIGLAGLGSESRLSLPLLERSSLSRRPLS